MSAHDPELARARRARQEEHDRRARQKAEKLALPARKAIARHGSVDATLLDLTDLLRSQVSDGFYASAATTAGRINRLCTAKLNLDWLEETNHG